MVAPPTAAELRARPNDSGYPGPNGPMPPGEFAVLIGCPADKGCQAWCHDGDRSHFNVILGAEVAEKVTPRLKRTCRRPWG